MRRNKTLDLTLIAIFTGIILLQSYVPNLGYIRILPMLPAISAIVLTIAIAGALLGPRLGALLGLVWGLISLLMAYTTPGDPISLLLFQNPVIAVLPRVLAGFFSGLVGQAFAKNKKPGMQLLGFVLSGVVAAITNTFLVIGTTSLFFMSNPATITSHLGAVNQNSPLIMILIVALGFNGVIEAIAAGIVTPIIATPLQRVTKHLKN